MSVDSVSPVRSPSAHEPLPETPEATHYLPEPLVAPMLPEDALARMLMSLQRAGDESLSVSQDDIQHAQERLDELREKFQEQLAEALEKAKAAQKKKSSDGWFSKTFGSSIDVFAKALGTAADFLKDTALLPFDTVVDVVKNLDDPEAMMRAMRHTFGDVLKNGATANAVEGFVESTSKFMGDLASFQLTLAAALVEGAVDGRSAKDVLCEEANKLKESFQQNIWENPDFWVVAGKIAQGIAVAGAIASFGVLSAVAITLVVLVEMNERHGLTKEIFGAENAPYADIGLNVAAALCLAGAGGVDLGRVGLEGQANTANQLAALLAGARGVADGVHTINEARRVSDELKRQAATQETMNQIKAIERMIDELLSLYEERSDARTETMNSVRQIVETQGATELAAIRV